MAEQSVIDELVVRLTLDAQQYEDVEVKIQRHTDRTERKAQERARTQDRRDKDQQRRLKDVGAGVRSFATQVAKAGAVVSGLGVALGASLVNLLGFETGLRRQAVGTALSNREMQAWGATARRLGADATAGAEAIAGLARERQQFELTGNAPTMQALARMGVNVDRNRPIEDVLADAQARYRAAPAGQQQQFENTLAAQGVSADLILMIKSERDAIGEYTKSFGQAIDENREALDALADTLESFKAQAISVTASLLSAFGPAIERVSEWVNEAATYVAEFANDVTQAGGGVRAFQRELEQRVPAVGTAIDETQKQAGRLSDSVALTVDAFHRVREGIGRFSDWFERTLNRVRAPWRRDNMGLGEALHGVRNRLRERLGLSTSNAPGSTMERIRQADSWLAQRQTDAVSAARARNAARRGDWPELVDDPEMQGLPEVSGDAQSIMAHLVTQYGKSPAEAAAITANWQRESGLKADAYNPEGGGTGARGIAQWRGARTQAFFDRYGVMPDQASLAQQIEFAMTDPYERRLMLRSLTAGGGANGMGVAVSRYYEAHGNVAEDARRGRLAVDLEREYRSNQTAAGGDTYNIQNLNVRADNPGEMVGGLQRLSGSQNYNSVQR